MERDFGSLSDFPGGRKIPHTGFEAPPSAASTVDLDDAYLNGCFSGLSFLSVLQSQSASAPFNHCSPCDSGVSASASHSYYQAPALPCGYFQQTFPAIYAPAPAPTPATYDQSADQDLENPKQEGLNTREFAFQLLKLSNNATGAGVQPEPLINFFSSDIGGDTAHEDLAGRSLSVLEPKPDPEAIAAHFLPYQKLASQSQSSSSSLGCRTDSLMTNRYVPYLNPSSSGGSRPRRQKMSDKTRLLQRQLPWDKKMDIGTMLEEAYKYIKFLQAQLAVLRSMPLPPAHSDIDPSNPYSFHSGGRSYNSEAGVAIQELGKLSRHQALQVAVNSPAMQTLVYSRGFCVYSTAQFDFLNKIWEQIMMFPPSSPVQLQYQPPC